jgi:hypothetical protein
MALKFLKIGNQLYSIIKTANKKRPFSSDMELQAYIDNFFLIGKMSNELKIIKIEQIINTCILKRVFSITTNVMKFFLANVPNYKNMINKLKNC